MSDLIKKTIVKLLRETADKIDAGNSNIEEQTALDICSALTHITYSKEEACYYVHLSRSRFDDLVQDGIFPKGRKLIGRKELVWYRDELDECIKKLR